MSTRIGFSTPKTFNPLSWIIRKLTGSRCSHTWFLYYDHDFQMEMVMEAHELGFRLIPYDRFEKSNVVVAVYEPQHSIDLGLVQIARSYLGTVYDYAGLLGMAVVVVGRFLKRKWKNPVRTDRSVFCSDAVVRAMLLSPGYEHLDLDPQSEEPEDLLVFFEQESAHAEAAAQG